MTVCIAAISDDHEAIVSCVDTQISTSTLNYEPILGRKLCGTRGWTILSSGTTCYAESLVDAIQERLSGATDNNPPTVKLLLEQALLSELPKFSAARYLAPYGIDMPTFLQSGATMFVDSQRNELLRSILDYSDRYDVELIVYGWGEWQEGHTEEGWLPSAHIYSVTRDGVVPHSDDGFYASGSGKEAAHSILSYFNHEPCLTLAQAIYFVAGAKFMSERCEGVGQNTVMRVSRRLGEGQWRGYFIQPTELKQLRRLWNRSGAPRMPERTEEVINKILLTHQPSVRSSTKEMRRQLRKAFGKPRRSSEQTSVGQQ